MNVIQNMYAGFVTTLKGMVITGRELFRKPITVQYPYEKRTMPDRFRGMLVNDANACIACEKCIKVCPSYCIGLESEGKGKNRKVTSYTIDYTKCCWCNLCVEACPIDSLEMTHEYEIVFTDRSKMIRDFVKDPIPPKSEKEEPPKEDGTTDTTTKVEKNESELTAA